MSSASTFWTPTTPRGEGSASASASLTPTTPRTGGSAIPGRRAAWNCTMSQAAVIRWHEGGEAPLLDDAEYVHENNAADVVDENACLCPDSECGRRERPNGDEGSLGDLYRSVKINRGEGRSFLSRLYDFAGPGALVAVGYMDPGNWATDLAAGSAYNYSLLFVILFSSILAMFLQELSLRLGHAARLDLAQACKQHFSRPVSIFMWITAEIAIAACDLAEVVGSAIAMKLLFGIPLVWGVAITACDVLVLIAWGGKSMRCIEITILVFMLVIFTCFVIEIWFAQPDVWSMLRGVVTPPSHLFSDQKMLLISVGILGATVMPHNLYLHSSIVQSRDVGLDRGSVQSAIFFSTIDSNLALSFSFFVNASIIVLAAATFYRSGHTEVTDIDQAYIMMSSLLGKEASSTLFAVALLASGQQSTITGTLAGQIVMEGFVEWSIAPWKRRLLTRIVAIAPAVAVVSLFGDRGVTALLVGSQVVLSLQLPFAIYPLVLFTSDEAIMQGFSNSMPTKVLAYLVAGGIAALNVVLVVLTITGV